MSFRDDNKPMELVSKDENDQVGRSVVVLVNEYPELPVDAVRFESIEPDAPSMTVSTVQGTYKTQEYINGSYEAEYPFKLLYRIAPGNSIDKRLKADELLNDMGDWLTRKTADLGGKKQFLRITRDTQSAVADQYNTGEEDHQIFLTLQYKVNP